jgi:hypothetical protein
MLETLSSDILLEIILHLSPEDILNLSETSKRFQDVVNEPTVWEQYHKKVVHLVGMADFSNIFEFFNSDKPPNKRTPAAKMKCLKRFILRSFWVDANWHLCTQWTFFNLFKKYINHGDKINYESNKLIAKWIHL